jgi:hypothetical protein
MRTSALGQLDQGLAVLSFFAIGALALAAGIVTPGRERAALVVNQHEVSREEFRWFMEQERAGVVAHFKANFNLEDGQSFWNHQAGGTTPKDALQKRTVDRLVREKVEQILFQELGLVRDIDYAAFKQQLQTLNREREEAAKEGKSVYGPIRYTQLQFYGHWKATLRARATEKLVQKQLLPTEESLRRFYEDNRSLFRAPPSCTLEIAAVQAELKPAAGEAAGTVQSTARKILSQLEAGKALPDLLKDQNQSDDVKVSWERREEINADRIGELFPNEQQSKAVLALAPGEATLLTDSDARARVVRCLGKVQGQDRPYEAVQQQVKDRWLGQQYDRRIKDLASQAQIQINQEAIDALFR